MRIILFIIILIALIMASGCLGEKTVIKANVTIIEHNDTPVIESIDVTSAKVSNTEDYKEVSAHYPGVYMKSISNMIMIDYWRSVDYTGPGEYELISELRKVPEKGDRVDVIIRVDDSNSSQMAKRTETIIWE
jgi:hypothetical protein